MDGGRRGQGRDGGQCLRVKMCNVMWCIWCGPLRSKPSGGPVGTCQSWAGTQGSGLWLQKDLGEGVIWRNPLTLPRAAGRTAWLESPLILKAAGFDEMTQGAEREEKGAWLEPRDPSISASETVGGQQEPGSSPSTRPPRVPSDEGRCARASVRTERCLLGLGAWGGGSSPTAVPNKRRGEH